MRFGVPAFVFVLLVAAAGPTPRPAFAAEPTRPNVVVILVDDLGWNDLSCFGGTRAATPAIDRLAAEGIRFRSFYVNAPICSPSRVALTTGQYPQRWRIGSYLAGRKANADRGIANWLDPAAPVLARELRRSGYATGHFGKWHMGGQRDVGDAPPITDYGFERSLTNFEGLGPRVLPLCDAGDGTPPRRHDLGSAALGRGPIRWEDRSRVTAAFVAEAIDFIDAAAREERPFYLNLWPDDVHSPYFPPRLPDAAPRQPYVAVLEAMDAQLRPLFDRIRDDPRLRDTTLVLFMSDNGGDRGTSKPLRRGKSWLYEGGVRSPLIVWGSGLVDPRAAGTVNETSVFCALDLNRSLYAITATPPPAGGALDGEDLSATLLGREAASREAPIFWRRPPDRPGVPDGDNPDLAVRSGRWKYHVNQDGSDPQLYDLEADVSETKNVAAEHAAVVARLHDAVTAWNRNLPADAGVPAAPGPRP